MEFSSAEGGLLQEKPMGMMKSFLERERGDAESENVLLANGEKVSNDENESKNLIESEKPSASPSPPPPESVPSTSSDGDHKEPEDEWMDILGNGQLKKKVITPGQPDSRPQKPDICEIRYEGTLNTGEIVEKEEFLEIHLGDNDVVQGLDFALALMDKGEEAEVIIAPRFGYGRLGKSPDIPADATLNYKIKLLNTTHEPSMNSLDVEQRITIGGRKKERGNFWYTREEYTLAIHSYRRALEYLDDTEFPGTPEESRVRFLLSERLKTYNNLGAAQMKISAFDAALISFGHVLSSQPKNVKALFRKAKIHKAKGEFEESIAVIKQALAIESDNKSLQQELTSLLTARRLDTTKQRDLYKKMMGNSPDSEVDKKKRKTSNLGTITWIVVLSFAVAAIGAVAVRYKIT